MARQFRRPLASHAHDRALLKFTAQFKTRVHQKYRFELDFLRTTHILSVRCVWRML